MHLHYIEVVNIRRLSLANLTGALIALAAVTFSAGVSADSNKLLWTTNGHYYQRFERVFTYDQSKAYCESLSGHLATITSDQEMVFIGQNLLNPVSSSNYYYLGGSDAAQEGFWKWITGESWSYVNFDASQPSNDPGENYLTVRGGSLSASWLWWDGRVSETWVTGLICEWSYNNYVGAATIGDYNGNGSDDIAALYVDYKTGRHVVLIRDGSTNASLKQIAFSLNDSAPLGIAVISDLNGNSAIALAVLYNETATGLSKVHVRDGLTGVLLRNYNVLNVNLKPKSITESADLNGNGANDFTVTGVNTVTGRSRVEIRDGSTNTLIQDADF